MNKPVVAVPVVDIETMCFNIYYCSREMCQDGNCVCDYERDYNDAHGIILKCCVTGTDERSN